MLVDAMQYQHFVLEADELGGWIEERRIICEEQDYKDFTNLQGKQPIRARYLGHVTGFQPIRD